MVAIDHVSDYEEGEKAVKRKKPMPGYYGKNIVCHVQKRFIQRRQVQIPTFEEKIVKKCSMDAVNKSQMEK